jgi:glutaredoxin
MGTTTTADGAIRVYWMTGCSSCLRTKEFLQKHGVPFLSRNVLEDESAYAELEQFGLKQVPIVTRGDAWANGQILRDVAKLCDIPYGATKMLSVAEMRQRPCSGSRRRTRSWRRRRQRRRCRRRP